MMNLVARILCLCMVIVPQQVICKERLINCRKIVNRINGDPKSTWKADTYGIKKLNIDRLSKTHFGLRFDEKNNLAQAEQNTKVKLNGKPSGKPEDDTLPTSFTWTDSKNTKCPVSHIRNQANCGSCWAVSTAAAFEDRICIQSKGKTMVNVSANYITACDMGNYGCSGGYFDRVYNFLKTGVITGGDFESDVGCQPYEVSPCTYVSWRSLMPCAYSMAITPKCRKHACTNDWYGSKKETKKNTFYAKSWKAIVGDAITSNEYVIRKDLYENGPLTLGFFVYEDFMFYKSGIYQPKRGQEILGAHAVRLVGWGVENGTKYWLIANSWSTTWGEKGFFRIIRGTNACEIESEAYSAMPDLK